MNSTALGFPDLHDATLDALALEWATGSAVAHLRAVGPGGGRPVSLAWHGVTEFHAPRVQPWGPSGSVLEVRTPAPGVTELVLQSGDVVRVRAAGCRVEATEPLAVRYAELSVDALCDAGLVPRASFARATEIVALEIHVRRSLGDV